MPSHSVAPSLLAYFGDIGECALLAVAAESLEFEPESGGLLATISSGVGNMTMDTERDEAKWRRGEVGRRK